MIFSCSCASLFTSCHVISNFFVMRRYKDGMLKAKSDDPETVNLIEGAAAGMVATVEKMGPDALEDWEVD